MEPLTHTTRSTCRICGSENLSPILSLGPQYISDFVEPGTAYNGPKCPIELSICQECTLVQNIHTAPQELLYTGHYWYRSGVTDTMREALRDLVIDALVCVEIKEGDIALDIGSNDGTLLRNYASTIYKVGFEPAKNLAAEGRQGVNVLVEDFWSAEAYFERIEEKAKIITAAGMFYDLEDPNQFIEDVSKVLHPQGVFVAQLMCLQNMINVGDIGNLAHEHLEFYTLQSLDHLLNKYGLEIFDIETNKVNGESYRLYIQHRTGEHSTSPSVAKARLAEADIIDRLFRFWANCEFNKARLIEFIREANLERKKIWVYGASTKGNTVLQYLGLTDWDIRGASERSIEKVGKVTAGSNIPIYGEEVARNHNPDFFLVLPYAFIDEFIHREKDQHWRKRGGKFIVPFPKLEVF